MAGLYVIKLQILQKNAESSSLSDYKVLYSGSKKSVSEALLLSLTDVIDPWISGYGIQVADSSSSKLELNLILDTEKNSNTTQAIAKVNYTITDIFSRCFAVDDGLPDIPNYNLEYSQSDNLVNKFEPNINQGGWNIFYKFGSLISGAQEILDNVSNTATEIYESVLGGTVSGLDVVSSIIPEQETIEGQSMGRGERTREDPNENINKRKIATSGIRNVFKNTYNPGTIIFDVPGSGDLVKKEIAQNTGFFPFVWYNAYQISYEDIDYFLLSHSGILPMIKIVFYDSLSLMRDKAMPLDDSKIKIFLNPRNPNLKPILMQFKILNFSVSGRTYTIIGSLDINDLYLFRRSAYSQSTSYEALKKIFSEMGLGFNSNIDDTDDMMTWINPGKKVFSFITDIVKASYKSDESFMLGYIDYYYHFNYVDIEKELSRDIKEELGIASFGLEEAAKSKNQDLVSLLFLSNDPVFNTSNSHIDEYKIINNSTNISIESGYRSRVIYYDDVNKDLLTFDVDSITTKGDNIILKGAPQDTEFYNSNMSWDFLGKLDSDNAHRNYNYAYVQNARNITDMMKVGLNVIMSTPNYNLYRYQKVQVLITNQGSTPAMTIINNRLSGEWLIASIKFEMSDYKFYQKISLIRRDLNLSPEELEQELNYVENADIMNGDFSNPFEDTYNPDELTETDVSSELPPTRALYTFTGSKNERVEYIINRMKVKGITNRFTQAAILAIVNKECGFQMVEESSYATTSAKRIKQIFKVFKKYRDSDVDKIKVNPKKFFDIIYGGKYGNDPDEGYKYRGRGFNQLTFKSNYRAIGEEINKDLINNPDLLLSDLETATDTLIAYFKRRFKIMPVDLKKIYKTSGDLNNFNSLNDATGAVYHANAGWGKKYKDIISDPTGGRRKTFTTVDSFYTKVLEQN